MTERSNYLDWLSLSRPGYRLLDVTAVGIPVYLVRADVLLLERRPVGPLDEFVMKSIDHGFVTVGEIAGVLGLDESLVVDTLVGLQRNDCAVMVPAGNGTRIAKLTQRGAATLETELREAPSKEAVRIGFDRLTWRVSQAARYNLLRPRDLEESGRVEVPPVRKRRVTTTDLQIDDIDREVRALRSRATKPTVLAVEWIHRADRYFLPAEVAVFEAIGGGDAQISVLIDRRPSPSHESALEKLGGLDYIGATLDRESADPTESLVIDYGAEEATELAAQAPSVVERDRAKRERVTISREPTEDGDDDEAPSPSTTATTSGVEFIDTYEHRVYLDRALAETKERLIIISPWISAHVVNTGFLERLAQLLRRRVQVHIGYGLDQRPGDRAVSNADERAEQALVNLSNRYENFTLVRLGNTHSKQLLFDDTHVSGSFNWLSFQGSRGKAYRHEESTVVRIKHKVDGKYDDLIGRLGRASQDQE